MTEASDHRLVYSRSYGGEKVTIYINKDAELQEFNHNGLTFGLNPYTYNYLKINDDAILLIILLFNTTCLFAQTLFITWNRQTGG